MPIKFTKEVSSHLFKYVSRIDIKFNRKSALVVLVLVMAFGVVDPLRLTFLLYGHCFDVSSF